MASGIDQRRVNARVAEPAQDRGGDELRPIVRPQVARRAVTLTSCASTSITRPERIPPATSIAKHSRVHSSTTVKHLSVCRLAQVSNTKSYATRGSVRSAAAAGAVRWPPGAGDAPRDLQPRLTPEAMRPGGAHHVSFPFQKDLDPAIPIAGILGRQTAHCGQGGRVPHRQPRLVAQRRSCDGEHGARAAVGQTA